MSVLSFCVQISPIPPLLLLPLARQAVIGVLQLITLRTSELERLVTRLEKKAETVNGPKHVILVRV